MEEKKGPSAPGFHPPPYSPPQSNYHQDQPPPYPHPYPQQGPPPQPQVCIGVLPTTILQLGPRPQRLCCPSCHANVQTTTVSEASSKTHLMALLLCFLGCGVCSCIPYCMDSCLTTQHSCPNCGAFIGSYTN